MNSTETANSKQKKAKSLFRREDGQVIVEYVLLLVVAVAVAVIMVGALVRREADDPGFLIERWNAINELIGEDMTSGNSDSEGQ